MTRTDPFPAIRFKGQLRPSQQEVVEIARRKLADGKRHLHIVAPPGSGKTVTGLVLWAVEIRRPAVVLAPNSAIQAQWAARVDLFEMDGVPAGGVSIDPQAPGLLTSLTYQSITLPRSDGNDLESQAVRLWKERLVEKGQAKDPVEAVVWIEDLARHNREYYEQRLAAYRKEARDLIALGGEAMKTLHASALATLDRLRQRGVGLIILDECHHLMGHWGRVLADAHDFLEEPIVLGLTATPPDRQGKAPEDIERYDQFFGPVDFEVPVPAVVKDGFLAPYQDLVYFVRPTRDELTFVANADEQLHALVDELCKPLDGVPGVESASPQPRVGQENSESGGSQTRPQAPMHAALKPDAPARVETEFHSLARRASVQLPEANGATEPMMTTPPQRNSLPDWLVRILAERQLPTGTVKDWTSFERRDPVFADAARRFLIARGVALPQGVPEPERQVSIEAANELSMIVPVLDRYIRHGLRRSRDSADQARADRAIQRLRMLGTQITETGSQACASPVGRVMAYSRSKAAALVPILKAERQALGDRIRAVVVADFEKTSAVSAEVSHLLNDEAGGAIAAFRSLLADPDTDALEPVLVTGSSVLIDDDLAPQFMDGVTKWLAGRRMELSLDLHDEQGFKVLVGSGTDWCPRVYVAMITDLFQQGLTKCLVGTRGLLGEGWDATKINVLVDLTTVTTSMSVNQLRGRSIRLDSDDPEKLADNWDVVCLAPEFVKGFDDYVRFKEKHETLFGLTEDGAVEKGVGHVHAAFTELKPEGVESSMEVFNAEMLDRVRRRAEVRARWRIGEPYRGEPVRALEAHLGGGDLGFPPFTGTKSPWNAHSLTLAVGRAVLGALQEVGLIKAAPALHVAARSGGYVRAFLENADEDAGRLFTDSLHEALGPLDRPRYVLPRHVTDIEQTWLSRMLPSIVARFFHRHRDRMAMLHAVPSALAKNKDLVSVFERHWNAHVSRGEAVYAYQGEGEQFVARARRSGHVPRGETHVKEIFH
jgi:hypothetical protein